MPRPMSSAMLAAIQASALAPALFVQAQFVTGTVYFWSGTGNISWNAHTWVGVGSLGSVSAVNESASLEATGIALTLSGIDATLLADVLQEMQLGAPVVVYFGLFAAGSLIADPVPSWAGRMDQPTIDIGGQTATITINCENRLVDMNVAVDRRYTFDDSQMDNPGDLGLQFVNSIQEITIWWGKTPVSSNNI